MKTSSKFDDRRVTGYAFFIVVMVLAGVMLHGAGVLFT
jgi:hypothetical protein